MKTHFIRFCLGILTLVILTAGSVLAKGSDTTFVSGEKFLENPEHYIPHGKNLVPKIIVVGDDLRVSHNLPGLYPSPYGYVQVTKAPDSTAMLQIYKYWNQYIAISLPDADNQTMTSFSPDYHRLTMIPYTSLDRIITAIKQVYQKIDPSFQVEISIGGSLYYDLKKIGDNKLGSEYRDKLQQVRKDELKKVSKQIRDAYLMNCR